MRDTFIYIGRHRYVLSYKKINREKDLFLFWGIIRLSKAIAFSCMKIDDGPIFITSPSLPSNVEDAVLHAMTQAEEESKSCISPAI